MFSPDSDGGFGNLQKGHAVAFADFDRDGDQDVFEVLGGAYPGDSYFSVLLENPGHGREWIGLKLTGVKSNRGAIGARVALELSDGRMIYRTVQPGSSFGDTPLEVHAGLGSAKHVKSVEIRWPSGGVQKLGPLAAGAVYDVTEGAAIANRLQIGRFAFSKHVQGAHH